MYKLDLKKIEKPGIELPTSMESLKKQENSIKKIYFFFIDYAKAYDCGGHSKLWKILQDMGITSHLICLLRDLYAGQEATVRNLHGTTDWLKIGKGVQQSYILSSYLFNLYSEYIMQNDGLAELQAGIKIARRNINNLRYAENISLMAEGKEELKSLLMRVKEEREKVSLKLSIQISQIIAFSPITSWQIHRGKVKTVVDFIF